MSTELASASQVVRSEPAKTLVALATIIVTWGVFFFELLFSDEVPYYRDLLRTYYPLRSFMADRLMNGDLPQWYPYENLGEPFLGQVVTGTFHPLSLLFLVTPLVAALKSEILICYLLALIGAFCFVRELGRSRAAGLVAAFAYGFSGYALAMSNNPPYLRTVGALPWLGWAAACVLSEKRPWGWVSVLAAVWASILLGGDVQGYLLGGVVVMTTLVATRGYRLFPRLVAGGILSLALSSIELIPAYYVRAESVRSARALEVIGRDWALHPLRIPEFIFAGWVPDSVKGLFVSQFMGGGTALWATSIFTGSVVVALAVPRTRRSFSWALLALAGMWLALGWYGGLHTVLRRALPLLDSFRFPEKYLVVWILGIAVASACGFDALRARWSKGYSLAVSACGGVCLAAYGIFEYSGLVGELVPPSLPEHARAVAIEAVRSAWSQGARNAGVAMVAMGLILVTAKQRQRLLLAIPVLVFAQLFAANRGLIPLVPRSVMTMEPALCAAAREQGAGYGAARVLPLAKRFPPSATSQVDGAFWASVMRNLMQPDVGGLCGIETLGYNLPGLPRRVRELLGFKAEQGFSFAPLFNVPFFVYDGPERNGAGDTIAVLPTVDYVLSKRPGLERAYVAAPRFVATAEAALALVRADPAGAAQVPVVELSGRENQGAEASGVVRIVEYLPERVELEVEANDDGVLVLNDQYYPGWSAFLDGKATSIHPVNYLARGVLVREGRHHVVFAYQTPGLLLGAVVSAIACLLSALLASVGGIGRLRVGGHLGAR